MTSGTLDWIYADGDSVSPGEVANAPASTLRADQLYLEHYQEVKAFLLTNLRNADQAEVLMQEVYLRLIAMDDLSVIHTPSAYLNRLARNLLIDQVRKHEREQKRLVGDPDASFDAPDASPSPVEQVHYQQLLNNYERALASLPVNVQQVVRLYHVEGLTQREIARRMGKSTSWVEKSMAQALLHCRSLLGDIEF